MTTIKSLIFLEAFERALSENDLAGKQRLQLFKITSLFGFLVFAILIGQLIVVQAPTPSFIIICILFVALCVNYFALSFHRNPRLAFTLLLTICFTMLHVCTYGQGGVRNSGIFYLSSLILIAFLMLGRRGGVIMSLLSLGHIVYFYFISTYTNWIDYSLIGEEAALIDLDYLVTGAFSILLLASLSNFIEKSKTVIIDDIILKKNELSAKNEKFVKSEEALSRINQQYARKNRELEQKNKELQQFNFVATHDLQEPLRTTASFVDLLQKQYQHTLDDRATKYLEYIAHASGRMQVLITDLIDHANIGHTTQATLIDCNEILLEVLSGMDAEISESQAVITASELPSVTGHQDDIRLLFHSLLFNAIKFRRIGIETKINITVTRDNEHWVFAFADNGIGIAKEHSTRIFSIFQRLHNRSQYHGSGIGLSHCKKIIELHKGEIWLESELGQGSTFYFSLPCNK